MGNVNRTVIALLVAVALTSAPAVANPMPPPQEPDNTGDFVFLGAVVAIGMAATAIFAYTLLSRRGDATSCTFAAEEVTITLTPGKARVRGTYTFYNGGGEDASLTVAYPFAAGEALGPAENVAVCDGAGRDVPFARADGKVSFDVAVPAGGRADVVVAFEQPCSAHSFTYILTTTRAWGRPLESARFVVEAPPSFGPVASTYPLEPLADDGAIIKYGFTRENFYPEEELTLSWQPAASGE